MNVKPPLEGASGALEQGREAYRQRSWVEARRLLSLAEASSPLDPADYEALATARFLLTSDADGLQVWEEAHHQLLERGDVPRAVRAAYWLGMWLTNRGDPARGSGWITRATRLLDEAGLDCSERGWLLVPQAIEANRTGDVARAIRIAEEVQRIGMRFGDGDLIAMGRHGEGRGRLNGGDFAAGLAVMDEVMVTVTSGEISPLVLGVIYCSVIDALHDVYDVGRAREWTAALERWCQAQPDLALFRGECMVHRAEVMRLRGDWKTALQETQRAGERFMAPPPHPAAGAAFYQEGEVHRLAGRFEAAEAAYVRAATLGRNPQPGMALLRLSQGRVESAEASITRELKEVRDPMTKAGILPAYVEIVLAAGDIEAARSAAAELTEIASRTGSVYLRAAAAQATGATLLSDGDAEAALPELRRAAGAWRELEATLHTAQVRLLIGLACRDLGDDDTATMEIEGAREAFRRLGATPELRRVEALTAGAGEPAGGLTGREVEVLALLARGTTNRQIAARLVISEKTVARHVSNIFNKLGVSNRAAATAYAFQHDLV